MSEDRSMRPDDHRRKWDLAQYEKAAKAREDVEKAMNRFDLVQRYIGLVL